MTFLRGDRVVCTADGPDGNVNIHNGDTGVVLADSWKRSHWILINDSNGFEKLFNNKPAEEDTCD